MQSMRKIRTMTMTLFWHLLLSSSHVESGTNGNTPVIHRLSSVTPSGTQNCMNNAAAAAFAQIIDKQEGSAKLKII